MRKVDTWTIKVLVKYSYDPATFRFSFYCAKSLKDLSTALPKLQKMTNQNKGRHPKKTCFKENFLICGWVGIKNPKLFSEKKQCLVYMAYWTIASILFFNKIFQPSNNLLPKMVFFSSKCCEIFTFLDTFVGHFLGHSFWDTLFWDTFLGHFFGTLFWDTYLGH